MTIIIIITVIGSGAREADKICYYICYYNVTTFVIKFVTTTFNMTPVTNKKICLVRVFSIYVYSVVLFCSLGH